MKKDQREVLTIEKIKSDLSYDCRAENISCVFTGLSVLFFIGAAVTFLEFILSEMSDWNIIPVGFATMPSLCALWCTVVFIATVRRVVIEKRIIKKGEFRIVTDTVAAVSEDEFYRRPFLAFTKPGYRTRAPRRRSVELENVFYFSRYGRVPVSKGLCDYSMRGDMFYLVVYNGEDNHVAMVYSSRIYRVEEDLSK